MILTFMGEEIISQYVLGRIGRIFDILFRNAHCFHGILGRFGDLSARDHA